MFFYLNEVVIQITQVNVNNSVSAGVYPVHYNFYGQTQFICSNLYFGCMDVRHLYFCIIVHLRRKLQASPFSVFGLLNVHCKCPVYSIVNINVTQQNVWKANRNRPNLRARTHTHAHTYTHTNTSHLPETVVGLMLWLRDPGLCDVEAQHLLFQKINIAGLSLSNVHSPADRLIIFPPIWWQQGEFSTVITGMFSHPLDTYSLPFVVSFIWRSI